MIEMTKFTFMIHEFFFYMNVITDNSEGSKMTKGFCFSFSLVCN